MTRKEKDALERKWWAEFRDCCERHNTMPMFYTALLRVTCNKMRKALNKH